MHTQGLRLRKLNFSFFMFQPLRLIKAESPNYFELFPVQLMFILTYFSEIVCCGLLAGKAGADGVEFMMVNLFIFYLLGHHPSILCPLSHLVSL